MKNIDLLKAINDIDDKYVEEAMPLSHKKRKRRSSFFLELLPTFFILLLTVCLSLRLIEKDKDLNNNTMVVNPVDTYQTLDNAESAIGFDFDIDLSKYHNLTYSVIDDEILEISYNDNNDYLICRKSKGESDNSGDYNTYNIVASMLINGINVSMETNDDNILVKFIYKGYSYSFSSNFLNESEIVKLVKEIIK